MLWTITILLVVLWALGMVSGSTLGAWVHILLVLALTSSPALRPEIPAWRLTPPIRLGSWAECLTALLVSPEALLPACPAVGRLRDKSLVATSSDIGSLREPGAILPRRERRGLPRILVISLIFAVMRRGTAAV